MSIPVGSDNGRECTNNGASPVTEDEEDGEEYGEEHLEEAEEMSSGRVEEAGAREVEEPHALELLGGGCGCGTSSLTLLPALLSSLSLAGV